MCNIIHACDENISFTIAYNPLTHFLWTKIQVAEGVRIADVRISFPFLPHSFFQNSNPMMSFFILPLFHFVFIYTISAFFPFFPPRSFFQFHHSLDPTCFVFFSFLFFPALSTIRWYDCICDEVKSRAVKAKKKICESHFF